MDIITTAVYRRRRPVGRQYLIRYSRRRIAALRRRRWDPSDTRLTSTDSRWRQTEPPPSHVDPCNAPDSRTPACRSPIAQTARRESSDTSSTSSWFEAGGQGDVQSEHGPK